jgi:hypothetical protein
LPENINKLRQRVIDAAEAALEAMNRVAANWTKT